MAAAGTSPNTGSMMAGQLPFLARARLFLPHTPRPRRIDEGDVVRVLAADRSFDCYMTVDTLSFGGLVMRLPYPRPFTPEFDRMRARAEQVQREALAKIEAGLQAELGGAA